MHFDADDPVGLVVVEDDAGGSCLKRDLWDSGIDGISVRGCDLTPGFAVRAGFENDVLERFGVGEALGGVEDFDAGEAVGHQVYRLAAPTQRVQSSNYVSLLREARRL